MRRRVLRAFRRRKLLDEAAAADMLTWQANGRFSVDASVRVRGGRVSKEAAQDFLKQALGSPELQEKLVAFAKEQDYEFSVEEMTSADLGGIAGGVGGVKKTMQTQV